MPIVNLNSPMPLKPAGFNTPQQGVTPALTANLIDAAGEYVDFMGHVIWDGQPASAKTVSSAGGKVYWRTGAVTWTTAGTTLRISIQDIDGATLIPRGDGTDDVYLDIVQGTTALAATTNYTGGAQASFTNGSKSIAHGDLICIRFRIAAHVSTNLVNIIARNSIRGAGWPAVSHNTASVAAVLAIPNVMLVADDGTVGWIDGSGFLGALTSRTFDSGTGTADEYGNAFSIPFGIEVIGAEVFQSVAVGTGTGYDVNLFTGSAASPTKSRTRVVDQQHHAGATVATSNFYNRHIFASPIQLAANEWFAITARPQDTNSDLIHYEYAYPVAGCEKAFAVMGGTMQKVTRLNDAGALTQDANSVIMSVVPLISGIDVPSGGGLALPPVRAAS